MHEHLGRKTLEDPDVSECLVRGQPLLRIPLETFLDKIQEMGVLIA